MSSHMVQSRFENNKYKTALLSSIYAKWGEREKSCDRASRGNFPKRCDILLHTPYLDVILLIGLIGGYTRGVK